MNFAVQSVMGMLLTLVVWDRSELFLLKPRDNPLFSAGAGLVQPLFLGGLLQSQVDVRTAEQGGQSQLIAAGKEDAEHHPGHRAALDGSADPVWHVPDAHLLRNPPAGVL